MCVLFAKSDNRVKNFDERKPKQEESDLVLKLRDNIDTIYVEGTKLIQLIIEGPIWCIPNSWRIKLGFIIIFFFFKEGSN